MARLQPQEDKRDQGPAPGQRPNFAEMSDEDLAKIGLSRKFLAEMQADRKQREARAPRAGTVAPDFRVEKLTRQGKRTGEFVSLAELRDKPVALMFGSYT